uniref:Uncharacterized protein n=1 Tax=viral metagenome TaxID=1070528 RepID=A0A6C0HCZ9_9ZZZZ
MNKFSELSWYCKTGVILVAVTAPMAVYRGAKLAVKWYKNRNRPVDVSKPSLIEDTTNTEIEVNL